MPLEKDRIRLDMQVRWRLVDKEKHIFQAEMKFDPDRYEIRTIGGQEGYYDKRGKLFIPMATLEKGFATLVGKPIYGPPNSIRDWNQYLSTAKERIERSLGSEAEWKPQLDRGDQFLQANLGRKLLFVVLYIDIVSSTQLSRSLTDVVHRTMISTFLHEMSLIVDAHGGYIHKYTGDGVIAFFPAEQSVVGATDSAVDSGGNEIIGNQCFEPSSQDKELSCDRIQSWNRFRRNPNHRIRS